MADFEDILLRAQRSPRNIGIDEIALLLSRETPCDRLFAAALEVKRRVIGRVVSLRGLVEAGNRCAKDCFYCGIRKSNARLERYHLSLEEIVERARFAAAAGYGSLVIQSGEIESEANTAFFERVLERIAPLELGVTLSLGEQSEQTYRRWRQAGASRYLLRIESSSPQIYARLHPATHDWKRRVECLRTLRRLGYQVGTGTMSALPAQTVHDLARDVVFFAEIDADMIGMGPYIPHPDTPLGSTPEANAATPAERLEIGLRMIAVTRLYLQDVNIAASTALQALADDGRERGLLAGANVIMPNVTDVRYRRGYQLYSGKPGLDENAATIRVDLERRLAAIGEVPLYGARGDSRHFTGRRPS